jgi:phage shock protein A
MLNQMLIEMGEQLVNAKRQVAVAIADEKRLLKQHEQERVLALDWEKKAMLAVKAGDDELAKQALERQADHAKQAGVFEQNWRGQKDAVEKLKVALQGLNNKIEDAKRKKNLLVARAKRAQAQQSITETMNGLTQTSAFDTISRMEEKIDQMEAEASATTELANEIVTDELEAKFQKLNVAESDDALKALKARMGMALPERTGVVVDTTTQEQLKQIAQDLRDETAKT